jgi:hypothetical protein
MELTHSEVRKCTYWDGRLRGIILYKNGMPEGEHKYWYDSGGLARWEFFQNGKLEGKRMRWYENGVIGMQEFYRNGKVIGERKFWLENGKLEDKTFYGVKYISICSESQWTKISRICRTMTRSRKNNSLIDKMLISDLIQLISHG